jgi:serine/threonine protein kinase
LATLDRGPIVQRCVQLRRYNSGRLIATVTLSPGTRLGPYEVLALVGTGGMGDVYKGRDTRLDRIVAVKVSKEQFSERVEREARAIAALNHPHICHLYDVGPNRLQF